MGSGGEVKNGVDLCCLRGGCFVMGLSGDYCYFTNCHSTGGRLISPAVLKLLDLRAL